jgi:hypothetical protein
VELRLGEHVDYLHQSAKETYLAAPNKKKPCKANNIQITRKNKKIITKKQHGKAR